MFRINKRESGGGVVYDMVNVKLTEFRWAGRQVAELIGGELRKKKVKRLGRSTTHRLPFLAVPGEERFAPDRADSPREDRDFIREKVAHYVSHQMANSYEDYLMNVGGIRDAVVFDDAGRCDIDVDVLDLVLEEMATLQHWDSRRRLNEWQAFKTVYCRNMAYAEVGERVRDHDPAAASLRVPHAKAAGIE
jgi:hypothetical protein